MFAWLIAAPALAAGAAAALVLRRRRVPRRRHGRLAVRILAWGNWWCSLPGWRWPHWH